MACCQGFIAFLLKFLNFLLTFVGIIIIIYSAFMLNHWHHRHRLHDPELPNLGSIVGSGHINNVVSALQEMDNILLPVPWFIYAFMGIGVILCCITCIGHVGAEVVNGCCLCFAFSLFLAIVLRALVSSPKINHDMEGDYDAIGRTREPLVDPRLGQISGLAKGDARGCHSDIWSSRMREKYHLDGEARHHIPNQNAS